MRLALAAFVGLALLACSAPPGTASPTSAPPARPGRPTEGPSDSRGPSLVATATASTPAPAGARPDAGTIFARLQPDLTACYERGKKAAPKMVDGRLTLNATVDAAGTTTCVIPGDDTGLTQEVEDCMSARLGSERFGAGPAANITLPVLVRGGVLELGAGTREVSAFDSIETHRMPDAFDLLETVVPQLQACVREIDRGLGVRSVVVGARVSTSGQTECAIATGSPVALPAKAAECTANVLRQTTFPKPSGGPGLILVPIVLVRR